MQLKQLGRSKMCYLQEHQEFDMCIKYLCVDSQCTLQFRAMCTDCYNKLHQGHRVIDLIEAERLAYQQHQEHLAQFKLHIIKLNEILQHSIKTIKSHVKKLQAQFKMLIEQELEKLHQDHLKPPIDLNDFAQQLLQHQNIVSTKPIQILTKGVKQLLLKSYFLTSDISVFTFKDYVNLSDESLVQIKRFDLVQKVLFDQITFNTNSTEALQIFNNHPQKIKCPGLVHIYSLDIKQDGTLIAVGGHPDTLLLIDPISEIIVKTFKTKFLEIFAVKFSSDGLRLAAAGSCPYEIYVWNCNDFEQSPIILKAQHLNQINRLQFVSKCLYTASDDYKLRVWKLKKNGVKNYKEYIGHWDSVYGLAINNKHVASTGKDKTLIVWFEGKILKQWMAHDAEYGGYCVEYSLDGKLLISTGYDKIIKFWSTEHNYKLIKQFQSHEEPIWTLGLLNNTELLATASWDNTIKIWDIKSGKCLYTLENHFHSSPCLNIKRYPLQFLATNEGGFILIWNL
ncbi:unnamed protein product (macronuclear) [Paramecium tetraurelia]|uniref:Uncharacterized protein n=1 Tax=Paramecium tetraurelia TaxID=5888 RepID=A0CQ68_PARTE|nr:uncharacterized protein GSPATT00009283001 [Paramecium tetraurelia]CAK72935.1 unnamed protein product [Paramecium tetraurelia]|eukprot:XP_001440332.1 hypothetical protein (macronuclear) [Paramecium tetraurelia strain d4-2]